MALEIISSINEEKCYVNGKLLASFNRKVKLVLFREVCVCLNKKEIEELVCWLIKIGDEI